MNAIKNFLQNASPKLKALVFSGIFIFLAIIVISIVSLIASYSQFITAPVEITNFSESFDEITLPDYYQTQIQSYVWSEIMSTGNAPDTDFIPATIREGSIKKFDTDRYTALVDIEPLHYSFRVSFTYNPELANQPYVEPGYYIECPYPDEVIYPDTPCPLHTSIKQLIGYLPYTSLLPDGTQVRATERTYSSFQTFAGESYIAISVNSCGNREKMKEANQLIRSWLKSLNLDPNDYHMEVLDLCE